MAVLGVDDLVELQPFEGASNRTALIALQRGRKNRYPVPYNLWRRTVRGKRIPEDASLDEVQTMSAVRRQDAQPVDASDATSPWISGRRKALQAVQKVLGRSDYVAKAGVCTWLNGVYWLEIVARRPDGLVVVSGKRSGSHRARSTVSTPSWP